MKQNSKVYTDAASTIQGYTARVDTLASSTSDLVQELAGVIPGYTAMSKADKWAAILDATQLKNDTKELHALIDAIQQLQKVEAELHVKNVELRKEDFIDRNKGSKDRGAIYSYNSSMNKDSESQDLANNNNPWDANNSENQTKIKLAAALEQKRLNNDEILALQKELDDTLNGLSAAQTRDAQSAIEKLKTAQAQLDQSIVQMDYDKNKKIQEGTESMVSQVLLHGDKLRNLWKSLWEGMAEDALKSLMGIQNSSPGIISQLLGLGGTKGVASSGGVSGGSLLGGLWGSGSSYSSPVKFASGGVTNGTSIAGEDGKEVVIPIEKNTGNSSALVQYAAGKLGTQVAPSFNNQKLNQQAISVNVNNGQTNALLSEQNEHIKQQTQIMINMAKDGGNNGTIMPIITQVSSEQVLKVLQDNPSAIQSLMSRNNSWGYK
jgi:hypothetical protein